MRSFFQLPVLGGIMCLGCGLSVSQSNLKDVKQVAFDRNLWIAAGVEKKRGVVDRYKMKVDVESRLRKGMRLAEILSLLGTPDLVRNHDDMVPEKTLKGEYLLVAYTLYLSGDNWPLELSLKFDKTGSLIDSAENYR